jgi:hypothetical protein
MKASSKGTSNYKQLEDEEAHDGLLKEGPLKTRGRRNMTYPEESSSQANCCIPRFLFAVAPLSYHHRREYHHFCSVDDMSAVVNQIIHPVW